MTDVPAIVDAWQSYYKKCGHAIVSPPFVPGQKRRITGYLDFGGLCPACEETKKAAKKPPTTAQPKITMPCPEENCKGTLVERTNRATGESFLGCDRYPECRYTRPLTEYLKMKKAGAPTLF